MADVQELITDLRIRDNLTVGLQKAKSEVSKFGNTAVSEAARTEKAYTGAADAIRGRFATLGADLKKGIGVGLGFGGVQLAAQGIRSLSDGFQSAIDNARDLTETINKSKVVFGPAAAEIEKFGDTAATSLGLSKNAAIGFAATFGNLFVSLGVGAEKIAPMSQALVTLGSDLASFNNIQTDEALTSLRAALVGEFEPARRLGVALSALTVEAKAAELGFTKVNGAFTEGDKIAARYALIMAQTGTAQGDFARTSQDLANQQRILDAQLENVSAQLGKALTPILTDLARVLNNGVLPALQTVGDNMDKIAPAAGALALIVGGKLALGIAGATAGFVANTVALIANSGAATVARGLAAGLSLAYDAEAVSANAAAAAEERLAVARAGGGIKGLVGAVAGVAIPVAAAVGGFIVFEEVIGKADETAATAEVAVSEYGHQIGILKDQLDQGAITQGQFDKAVAEARDNFGSAAIAAAGYGKVATGITTAMIAASIAIAEGNRELVAAKDALNIILPTIGATETAMLGAGKGTDVLSDALLRGANDAITASVGYGMAADQLDRLRSTAGKPFVVPPTVKIPGLDTEGSEGKGVTGPESFLSDLEQDQRNRDEAARRERERQDEADRRRREGLAKAKADAADYAATLKDKLNRALERSKDLVTTLFDKQHEKALRAITDVEKLASKQHDAALQQISDTLKLRLEQSAAPVTAAEEAQRRIEIARQRRDLGEGLAAAQASGDPESIRNAQEALQSFNANQRIAALRLEQAKLDAAAQEAARLAQKAADDQLAAAKLQAAKDIALESDRNKKQRAQFEKELEALKRRDAGASPAKVKKDIAALEEKFGITTDVKGFHHIEDLAAVAKDLKPNLTGIGDAAAVATPGLVAVGTSATAAADGLAVFTRSLGALKVLELPIPKPVEPPDIRQPVTVLDQPRLSEAEILANAIKNFQIPAPNVYITTNYTSPPIFLNGRLIAAALASSQSPAATPGVRTGILSPRP